MYRLVASDLDQTFLGPGHYVPPANIDAIKRMRELGVLFVPSSGRPYPSIMADFAAFDQSLFEGSYVLSYNGGTINRYGDPTPIADTAIDRSVVEKLYAYAVEHRIPVHVYTASGKIFTQFLPEVERTKLTHVAGIIWLDDEPEPARDLSFAGDEEFAKILYMDPSLERVKELAREVEPLLDPELVTVTYSSNCYAEFVPASVNKGAGLKRLADMLGIDMAETIGVGDSANDIEMLKMAGLGVGVANVSDDARPSCDLVLETKAADGAFPELVRRVIEPEHLEA